MKYSHYSLALLLCCTLAFAEDVTTTAASPTPSIGKKYIKDYVLVPIRSGASSAFRVIDKGIKSGTEVELLKINNQSQYSMIRTPTGLEGWLPSQYLMDEIPCSTQLEQAQTIMKNVSITNGGKGNEMKDLISQNQSLTTELAAANTELEKIRSLSSDEIKLSDENQKMLMELQEVKNHRDTLATENQELKSQITRDSFINGAIAVILGIFATLIIQHITKSNRRHSEWA